MDNLETLCRTAYNFPAIDNHCHALLLEESRDKFPLEGMFEAEEGAMKDVPSTTAALRATLQLGKLFGMSNPTWENVKRVRAEIKYDDLCDMLMRPTKIAALLLDDGLGGISDFGHDWKWHARFGCDVKRIVRIETCAEDIIVDMLTTGAEFTLASFQERYTQFLIDSASRPEVAGFKSVACYRTGLDITLSGDPREIEECLPKLSTQFMQQRKVRLAHKPLNDHLVRICLGVAAQHDKPIQFHTGLGDKDITLTLSSPAHMQPVIAAYPKTKFVLLHSSYPYTREAGYLTLVYDNCFLDFGEIFPMISGHGQRSVVREMLEVAPTSKLLWSTDGHWFPETYYLGTLQARQALYAVLSEMIQAGELTEKQSVKIIEDLLFHNSNRVYNLGLQVPAW